MAARKCTRDAPRLRSRRILVLRRAAAGRRAEDCLGVGLGVVSCGFQQGPGSGQVSTHLPKQSHSSVKLRTGRTRRRLDQRRKQLTQDEFAAGRQLTGRNLLQRGPQSGDDLLDGVHPGAPKA
ncbi:hypothetical protein FHR81_000399 [Actinoalloteichus hoggarensis]|uniref:hypothetical protein n=1 Tax=Actinoalloteichus hoggarensis TaxID=1470176 RepID=UPI0012FE56C1|nr:hypothetical protein [Actinoalloteichus hoggarensis]MBB5919370.1 hypothetical protein [Actinoalloteichus hoggarensis]